MKDIFYLAFRNYGIFLLIALFVKAVFPFNFSPNIFIFGALLLGFAKLVSE